MEEVIPTLEIGTEMNAKVQNSFIVLSPKGFKVAEKDRETLFFFLVGF